MTNRKLIAALVGLSLAAGSFGTALAQTAAPLAQSASPADTAAAAPTATKSDSMMKKAPAHRTHHPRMMSKTHRKHVSEHMTRGTKMAAKHTGKRIRISHVFKHGTPTHV